jgi:small GTP-binding protein
MQNVLTPSQQAILQQERDLFALLETIAARLDAPAAERELLAHTRQQLDAFFLLVVVGEFNSGKSAFINTLLGARFLDEGVTPTTSQIHVIGYAPRPVAEPIEPFVLRVGYPVEWLQTIHIVDTPGTNAVIRRHQQITEGFIPRADLILFITSADRPFSESERAFLELVKAWGKKVVVVVNKIDILENEAAINQVVDFVRDQATMVLGVVPRVFPVSVRWAQYARLGDRTDGDAARLLEASRFVALEDFILRTLDQQQRLLLKLSSPLGVAERLRLGYEAEVNERLQLLQDDFVTLEHVETLLTAYVADMRHDLRLRLQAIANILHELRARGDRFFEEMIRFGRLFDLLNGARLRAEFERVVIADTHHRLEEEVNALIDWLSERNYRQWQDVTGYLNRRAERHGDRIVGEIGGRFDLDRRALLQSVGRRAREIVASYDHQAAAIELSTAVKNALAAMGAVELGALGLGTLLLHLLTRALDPLGLVAAGGLALAGLFILPARRRAAKNDLDARIEAMRERLVSTLTSEGEHQIDATVQAIREAISPYTRFIRVEFDKLTALQQELDTIARTVRHIQSQLHALEAVGTGS